MLIGAKPLTTSIHRLLYNLKLKCAIMKNAASYIPVSTRRLYSYAVVWFIKLCYSFQQYNWKLWFSSIGASFNCIWSITWKGCSFCSPCRWRCSRCGKYRICVTAPTGMMLSKPLAYFAMSTFFPRNFIPLSTISCCSLTLFDNLLI